MTIQQSLALCLAAATTSLESTHVNAFLQPTTTTQGVARRSVASFSFYVPPFGQRSYPPTELNVFTSEDQALHTAERISGMSRGEIQHIFEDIDADGSGNIDLAEIDLLSKYFPGEDFSDGHRKRLMTEIDTDKNGVVDAEEFYKWMVVNAKSEGTADGSGTKKIQRRKERLEVGRDGIPPHLMELLEELGVGAVVQKVTHPLHSAFGRTLYDHFVSCYLIAKEWGNSEVACQGCLFHALYQRGDGMRAVNFEEYRPKLQKLLGEDVEQLLYLFPSAHKSALLVDGLLMAPVGEDLEVPNVLEGGMVTIPKEVRPALVEMEVINSHDQHVLENSNPVHNLWQFYQHVSVLKIMSAGAREAIVEYQKRAAGATVADVLKWHESRFALAGKEVPELWQKHLNEFRAPCGKFHCVEMKLKELADKNGDGELDWDEFTSFDFDQCLI